MYYRFKAPWAFRGWKKTPYALQTQYGPESLKRPFFTKEVFLELLDCNGEEDVELSALSRESQQIIREYMEHGYLDQSESPMEPMESWQCYHVYPSRYVESVHWSITGKCNFN